MHEAAEAADQARRLRISFSRPRSARFWRPRKTRKAKQKRDQARQAQEQAVRGEQRLTRPSKGPSRQLRMPAGLSRKPSLPVREAVNAKLLAEQSRDRSDRECIRVLREAQEAEERSVKLSAWPMRLVTRPWLTNRQPSKPISKPSRPRARRKMPSVPSRTGPAPG